MVAYATRPISDLVAYCRRVSDLTRLLALAAPATPHQMQVHQIRRFVAQLHAQGLSGRSLGRTSAGAAATAVAVNVQLTSHATYGRRSRALTAPHQQESLRRVCIGDQPVPDESLVPAPLPDESVPGPPAVPVDVSPAPVDVSPAPVDASLAPVVTPPVPVGPVLAPDDPLLPAPVLLPVVPAGGRHSP